VAVAAPEDGLRLRLRVLVDGVDAEEATIEGHDGLPGVAVVGGHGHAHDVARGAGVEHRDAQAYDGWLSFSPTAEQYVYGLHHSKSPGNRYRINDPEIDAWADQHQVELDPAKRRDLAQKVWNKVYDQVYRVDKPTAFGLSVYQPWIRGLRTGRGIGSGQHYLDIQNVVRYSWIDK